MQSATSWQRRQTSLFPENHLFAAGVRELFIAFLQQEWDTKEANEA
jgi:hypothetical protein